MNYENKVPFYSITAFSRIPKNGAEKTEDNEKRSFGGYTSDIDKCEMYTLKEIEEKNYRFPVYEEGMSFYDFIKLFSNT